MQITAQSIIVSQVLLQNIHIYIYFFKLLFFLASNQFGHVIKMTLIYTHACTKLFQKKLYYYC